VPTGSPYENWTSIGSSSDGIRLVATASDASLEIAGPIYVSNDSGLTWILTGAPLEYWTCVASSADGSKLVAGTGDGRLYVWQEKPLLSITAAASNKVVISWAFIYSTADFILQENSDLSATNWTNVLTAPAITNSQKQVTLPLAEARKYYRLKAGSSNP